MKYNCLKSTGPQLTFFGGDSFASHFYFCLFVSSVVINNNNNNSGGTSGSDVKRALARLHKQHASAGEIDTRQLYNSDSNSSMQPGPSAHPNANAAHAARTNATPPPLNIRLPTPGIDWIEGEEEFEDDDDDGGRIPSNFDITALGLSNLDMDLSGMSLEDEDDDGGGGGGDE